MLVWVDCYSWLPICLDRDCEMLLLILWTNEVEAVKRNSKKPVVSSQESKSIEQRA